MSYQCNTRNFMHLLLKLRSQRFIDCTFMQCIIPELLCGLKCQIFVGRNFNVLSVPDIPDTTKHFCSENLESNTLSIN